MPCQGCNKKIGSIFEEQRGQGGNKLKCRSHRSTQRHFNVNYFLYQVVFLLAIMVIITAAASSPSLFTTSSSPMLSATHKNIIRGQRFSQLMALDDANSSKQLAFVTLQQPKNSRSIKNGRILSSSISPSEQPQHEGSPPLSSTEEEATMDTSLTIIPPSHTWDTIQRARHYARDVTYHTWPPCLRLFHPFAPKSKLHPLALEIAKLVEEEQIEPFEITLNTLLIVPHLEVLEENIKRMKDLPTSHDAYGKEESEEGKDEEEKEQKEQIQQMIRREEAIGKERLKRRLQRKQKKLSKNGKEQKQSVSSSDKIKMDSEKSPKQNENKDYNGPCIICLEPDDSSKKHIESLRSKLLHSLPLEENYDAFSLSSSLSQTSDTLPDAVLRKHRTSDGINKTFRPVLPIGSFPTVASAVKVASKLQSLWEPLTFNVTDLHLISRGGGANTRSSLGQNDKDDREDFLYKKDDEDIPEVRVRQRRHHRNQRQDNNNISSKRNSNTNHYDDNTALSATLKKGQYGCDAMVMLCGEEDGIDMITDEENFEEPLNDVVEEQELLRLLLDAGEEGGAAATNLFDLERINNGKVKMLPTSSSLSTKNIDEDENDVLKDTMKDWETYLDDDDWDEGATVIIGRVHFFVGEMRQYIGMPASSTMDGKDRVMGDNISAADRRRPSMSRKTNRWEEGDYGHKDSNFYSSS